MPQEPVRRDSRRDTVAQSAIRIIARDGVRALTHRAVDHEAGLPQGSTSHLARTRDALLAVIVESLASRTLTDTRVLADAVNTEEALTVDELADLLVTLVNGLAGREDDMRARYALILELRDRPDLLATLTEDSEVGNRSLDIARTALDRAGLPTDRAEEVVGLTDSLTFRRIALRGTAATEHRIFESYLRGITQST